MHGGELSTVISRHSIALLPLFHSMRKINEYIADTAPRLCLSRTQYQVEIETGSGGDASGLDPHAAAAAVKLALYKFDWKTSKADKDKKIPVNVKQLGSKSASASSSSSAEKLDWTSGTIFADSQNLARELMDTPANLMTPTIFSERTKKEFEGVQGVTVNVYDEGE